MKIRSLKLHNESFGTQWSDEVQDRWNYADFLRNEKWRKGWVSFDGVVYHAGQQRVYLGITSFDADIFKAYDVVRGSFIDLGFKQVGNAYDAKFHRSMELTGDGKTLYTATALLHDIDRYWEAPGGSIYRTDIEAGAIERLGIPLPHNYIQSIALDESRGLIYSMHFTPERLSRFELSSGKSWDLGPLGSGLAMAQGENLVLDDAGNVWCSWNATRAWQSTPGGDSSRLCKFDVERDRMEYYDHGLPRADGSYGNAKLEGLFNFGTGVLYASGGNGSLYRLCPSSGEVQLLGTPISAQPSRLTSMALHSDGCAYGITGRQGQCRLLRLDLRNDKWELGDAIVDEDGIAMWQCHDIAITPEGVLYTAENDHPARSSYLWEITL
jgi:hypothetical protein